VDPVLVVVILPLFAVAWWFLRTKQKSSRAASESSRSTRVRNTTFHAVSIKPSKRCCNAAKELAGHRFLAAEAPRLPLADCGAPDCQCRFSHHKDRRASQDRRSPFARRWAVDVPGGFDTDRRQMKGRRESDLETVA